MVENTATSHQLTRAVDRKTGLIVVALGTAVTTVVYLATLSPGLGWHDSAELALRAHQLGATHAPGSPLHTVLGHMLGYVVADPAFATNILSAAGMGIAAGLLALLAWLIGGRLFYVAAMLFAFSYQVWASAVVTELYGPAVMFVALSSLCFWQWHLNTRSGWLLGGLLAYAAALACWFANLLFVPAIFWLIVIRKRGLSRESSMAAGMIALAVVCIATANVWLSLRLPSFGPDKPDSIVGLFRYMSGAMHDPLAARDLPFYMGRVSEHLFIFARNYLWLGIPVGLLGMVNLARQAPGYGGYLILLFIIQMSYFTLFGSGDYYTMVVVSYFVFSLWVVAGASVLIDRSPVWQVVMIALLAGILIVQLYEQLPGRRAAARQSAAQSFVDASFAVLPAGSLAIAGWQQFAPLKYAQVVQGSRPDLEIILPAATVRHYGGESIANYLDYVREQYCTRPIFTHKVTDALGEKFTLGPLTESPGWFRLKADESTVNCDQAYANQNGQVKPKTMAASK